MNINQLVSLLQTESQYSINLYGTIRTLDSDEREVIEKFVRTARQRRRDAERNVEAMRVRS